MLARSIRAASASIDGFGGKHQALDLLEQRLVGFLKGKVWRVVLPSRRIYLIEADERLVVACGQAL